MTFVTIFLAGMITGAAALVCYALCEANKGRTREEKQESQGGVCNDCFGAAAGDCTACRWNNEDIQEERETHAACELCMDGELWERKNEKHVNGSE